MTKPLPRFAVATAVAVHPSFVLVGLFARSRTRSGWVESELTACPPPPRRTLPAGQLTVAVTCWPVVVGEVDETLALTC
jgi:hypothetical protein